jgi:hypothetical protein
VWKTTRVAALVLAPYVLISSLNPYRSAASEAVAPYVVTTREDVQRMLDIASVGPGDFLIDLGSGDGRIPISAAQRGALSLGVDIEPELVRLARQNAVRADVDARAQFRVDNVFSTPLAEASVVTLYLMPEVNLRLRPRLLCELEPGTRVVSNTFTLGEWAPYVHVPGRSSGGLLMWVVPKQVGGRWKMEGEDADLHIEQHFQKLLVTTRRKGDVLWQGEGIMRGSQFTWTGRDAEGRRYSATARAAGDALTGAIWHESPGEAPTRLPFTAQRTEAVTPCS